MNIGEIIAALIPIFAQAAPTLIQDIINLMKGNPQQQGEVDEAYIARLGLLIDQNTASVEAQDKEIQK